MKRTFVIVLFVIHCSLFTCGQEIPAGTEQQLEDQTAVNDEETEDDSYLQDLDRFRKTPINLNTADADEIKQLQILTDLQIENLLTYRKLFGKLVSIYELQAVPCWDIPTIRKLLPFVTIAEPVSLREETGNRFHKGEHSLLFRVTQVLERAEGFNRSTAGNKYPGSRQKIFFRYRYTYKDLLQFGLLGEKDAGEQFLKGAQRKGFDFYSFHFFARKMGIIRSLALGDFSVSLGQGLIEWQGLAFKKSGDITNIKRQSAVLRPYSSAGEFYFHRGAGITIQKGKIESTAFISLRKMDGNLVTDTVNNENFVSSFLSSGNHRTASENGERNNITQTVLGGNIVYRTGHWHIGMNGTWYKFSLPLQKREEPYNLYAIKGDNWSNASIDYSYTYRNFHFFGEAAADKHFNKAFINGLLLSVDPAVDLSLVQRSLHKAYRSVNGNAFTENTYPGNETGLYTGITVRPATGWRFDAYADLYKFPWLRYQADAPGYGKDFLALLTYAPNRQTELYTRFRNEAKPSNQSADTTTTSFPIIMPKQSWRTQVNCKINSSFVLRNRVELLWYDNKGAVKKETGFLSYADIIYRPLLSSWSGMIRLQYFETDGYNSRIYAYENDVLYSYSIPAFSGKGFRYYLVFIYDPGKKLSFWVRLARAAYRDRDKVGSGPDEIPGNRRTELKLQARVVF